MLVFLVSLISSFAEVVNTGTSVGTAKVGQSFNSLQSDKALSPISANQGILQRIKVMLSLTQELRKFHNFEIVVPVLLGVLTVQSTLHLYWKKVTGILCFSVPCLHIHASNKSGV